MIGIDYLIAEGHKNIKAKHKTTLEVTKDNYLTPRGDCIIGINSNKGAKDLDESVKRIIATDGSYVYAIVYLSKDIYEIIRGRGSSKLTLSNENKIIVRKSDFISDATIAIRADKAAKNVKRDLIQKLRDERTKFIFSIIASDKQLIDEEILRIFIYNVPFNQIEM